MSRQEGTEQTGEELETIHLNGVSYALARNQSKIWRVGSARTDWQARLALFPSRPNKEELDKLASDGIFVAPNSQPAPIAVMCAGLGAVWPGMGRELYDNFPAARAAMDEIASLSEWNVLGLMDEKDPDLVNSSRYQIPYLFLLEYAQWSQFRWLGLEPDLICGHSLGELVALCLAGVYPVEAAWLLLDTRARHMERLEKMGNGETGMLAVSGDKAEIDKVLEKWPQLDISNANTPRQFVLGGPRDILLEARRHLRKSHIPAFLLPINLAFHNPAMHILRDLSTRRLNALEMHAPQIPMLSCVTAGLYPKTQAEISRYIADLDENTVNWTASITAMRDQWHIRSFLELGPQDILCGITRDNDPEALCIASDLKDHETETMRMACARLFAAGYLPTNKLATLKSYPSPANFPASEHGSVIHPQKNWASFGRIPSSELEQIISLVASITNQPKSSLSPDMDLRYDLGLKSTNFPLLLQEAETRLGKNLEIEKFFTISTLGELALFLAGKNQVYPELAPSKNIAPITVNCPSPFCWQEKDILTPALIRTDRPSPLSFKQEAVLLWGDNAALFATLWESLAPLGLDLVLPDSLASGCQILQKAGSSLIPLNFSAGISDEKSDIISKLSQKNITLSGIFAALPALKNGNFDQAGCQILLEHIFSLALAMPKLRWLCIFLRLAPQAPMPSTDKMPDSANDFFKYCHSLYEKHSLNVPFHAICENINVKDPRNRNESADLLALNLLYGQYAHELWAPGNGITFCKAPDNFFFKSFHPESVTGSRSWHAAMQYSSFTRPQLLEHGPGKKPWNTGDIEILDEKAAWLPAGEIARRVLEAGQQVFPWLIPFSLQDFNLFSLPLLAEGITRECRVAVLKRPWLIQNNTYVRLCKIETDCRNILPNGRHGNNWNALADGIGGYAAKATKPIALWQIKHDGNTVAPTHLEQFYRQISFGKYWHFLKNAAILPARSQTLRFQLQGESTPKPCSLAQATFWGYAAFSRIVESIVQAAFFAAALHSDQTRDQPLNVFKEYGLAMIGFMQFNWPAFCQAEKLYLETRLAWQNNAILRYDAQVLTSRAEPILTMTHMELEKQR